MGSKSQVRSMQRGAQKRDAKPMSPGSDYARQPPSLRTEDRAHLGLTDETFDKHAASLKPKVLSYARAGFRKPADVTRLLNREEIRTLSGGEWNPRLVYFMLSRIYGDRPRKPKPTTEKKAYPDQNRFDAARQAVRRRDKLKELPPVAPTAVTKTSKKNAVEKPKKPIKVRPPAEPVPLSAAEMANRLAALKAHFS